MRTGTFSNRLLLPDSRTPQVGSEPELALLVQPRTLGPSHDLDWALDLLRATQAGTFTRLVRIYRPEPTLSFGQRDTKLPGFDAAQRAAAANGFAPVVRRAGGRAAPYHRGSLVVDHLEHTTDATQATQQRFAQFAQFFVEIFASIGVPSQVGELVREYCPGEYSVHATVVPHVVVPHLSAFNAPTVSKDDDAAPFKIKLVGTAQRVIRDAWLFSSSIIVEDPESVRRVTTAVYSHLGLPLDPQTVGAMSQVNPAVNVEAVIEAIRAAYLARYRVVEADFETLLSEVPLTLPASL